MAILEGLLEAGASVRVFDPVVNTIVSRDPRPGVEYSKDEYAAATGADALVLATEWNQFRSLDFGKMKELLARPVLIDLRNIYGPQRMREQGFEYTGVGR